MRWRRPEGILLLALATLVLGYSLQINDGFSSPAALAGLILTLVLASAALLRPWGPAVAAASRAAGDDPGDNLGDRGEALDRALTRLLLAGLAINLVLLGVMPPGYYLIPRQPTAHPFLLAGLAAAAALIVTMARDRARARRLWFPLLLVVAAALGVWMIGASPRPKIDVLTVHKFAIAALRAGENPYAIIFPNIYGDLQFYSAEAVQGRTVMFGLPYPPLSLLMALPGQVFLRDIRFAELAALVAGAACIGYAPRRRSTAELSIVAPLAAALLLFTPRGLFVLEQGWTESFAILWLGASVFAACRMPRLLPWTLALLVSVKQHMGLVIPLALLALPRPLDARAAVRLLWPSLVLPLALALPFLIWNAPAFLNSVVWLQLREPFRQDSLSLLSLLAQSGVPIERDSLVTLALPLAMLALAFAIAWRHAPRTPAGFAGSLGFVLLLLFAGSKKAFCNYYYFVIAAFCCALAAGAAPAAASPASARTPAPR